MNQALIGNRVYNSPSNWQEISAAQLVKLADVLHSALPKLHAKVRATHILLNVRKSLRLRWLILFRLSPEAKYDLNLLCEWVFDHDYDQTKNLLPVIRAGFHNLYGPPDECKTMRFLEFIEADMAYLDFRQHWDDSAKRNAALDKLVAILYRDPQQTPDKNTWNGDYRVPYNSAILKYRLPAISKISTAKKLAVLMFYHACHTAWEKQFPKVFKKSTGGDGGGGSWAPALRSLAGGAIHMEKMAEVNAMTALYDLNEKVKEIEELESRTK